jgi:hypothetical protein
MGSQRSHISAFATQHTAATREQRIGVVAWQWNRQYSHDARFKALGFSEEEIREGNRLGYEMGEEYYGNRCYYGDPAYGSWPAGVKQPIRDKVLAMLRIEPEPTEVLKGEVLCNQLK